MALTGVRTKGVTAKCTNKHQNCSPVGSGSIGPGTGTTALPLAAMALSQKRYTGRGGRQGDMQPNSQIGSTHLRAARPEIAIGLLLTLGVLS